jgi:hypothetical protein
MSDRLQPPICDVRELFEFLASWRDVPGEIRPVALHPSTPPPLRALYQRFGLLAAKEWWVRPNLCWSEGLFSGQNFLVAPTRLGKEHFEAEGRSHWLVVSENQHCWFAWVPVEQTDDPPITYTPAQETPSASVLESTSTPLSRFLAVHVLVETTLASPRLWCIGARPFRAEDFLLPLLPLLVGSSMGLPPLQYDFYVDPGQRILVMNMPGSDFTWVASRDLAIESILVDPGICEDCRGAM